MADEDEGGSKANPAALAGGFLVFLALIVLGWFMVGGWRNADLRGYFLAPPSSPQINVESGVIQGPANSPPTYPDATSTPRL